MIVLAPHSTIIECVFGHYHEMISGSPASPVVKDGIRDLPLAGALLEICNPIYVNRENHKSRSDTVHEINKRVNVEQPYPQVAIFPEGTCSNAQALLTFKIGAFIPRGKIPISCWLSFDPFSAPSASLDFSQLLEYYLVDSFRPEIAFDRVFHSRAAENTAVF